MTVSIKIKRRTTGSPGAPSALLAGELAFNEIDNTLYFGFGDDGSGNATSITSIGGLGAFMALTGSQTISGAKTFTGTLSLGASATAATPSTSDSSQSIATTAFVKAQGYLTSNQAITFTGDATGSGTTSVALTLASIATAGTYTKVSINAKGQVTSGTTLSAGDIPNITTSQISNFSSAVEAFALNQFTAPTTAVSFNGQSITNVAAPVNPTDAANKQYVDSNIQGLNVKPTAQAATTAALPSYTYANGSAGVGATLTANANAALVVDSYSPVVGNLILVKNETGSNAAYNGLYVVTATGSSSSAWVLTRQVDMDTAAEFSGGFVPVENNGATLGNTLWLANPSGAVTVGTTAIPFTQLNGATQIVAGNGINYSGNTVSVVAANSGRIVVSGSGVDLATAGTSGSYFQVTTDAYGRVISGANPTTLLGFGITNAQTLNATLTSLAGLSGAANQLVYFTGSNTLSTTSLTAYAISLIAATSASAAQSTLGLGTMATQNASAVAITGGTINGVILDGGTF